MKQEVGYSIIFVFIMLAISNASATFTYQGEQIERDYSEGSAIRGTINLNFSNEASNSLFTSTYPGSIKLYDLLTSNGLRRGVDFKCTTFSCSNSYKKQNSISSLEINGNEKLIGFALEGDDVSIESADIIVSSDAPTSCTRQILIDVGDEEKVFLQNTRYTLSSTCGDSSKYGCFSKNLADSEYSKVRITNSGQCEKISLPPAPSYSFGARIENSSEGMGVLKMELFSNESVFLGECNLPGIQQQVQDTSCIINRSIMENEEYYVCISLTGGSAKYQIRAEKSGDICGLTDILGLRETLFDYEIFAQPLPYDTISEMSLAEAFERTEDSELRYYLDDYIERIYDRNCTGTCMIPFKITGGNQQLLIDSASLEYSVKGNILTTETLYEIERKDSLISSDALTLELSHAQFIIPKGTSKKSFEIFLGGRKIIKDSIPLTITQGFEFSVAPRNALIGVPTNFVALTNQSINQSIWVFGDGIQKTSASNAVTHRYLNPGNYTLEVTLKSSRGLTTKKSFSINVGNSKQSAESLINISRTNLNKIKQDINTQPTWVKPYLEKRFNVTSLEVSLNEIARIYSTSQNESDYSEIVDSLIELNIPETIYTSNTKTYPFSLGFGAIDVGLLEKVSNQNVSLDKQEELIDNVIYWNEQSYEGIVTSHTLTARSIDGDEENLVTRMNFKFTEKAKQEVSQKYLIINYPIESITFKGDYSQKKAGDDFSQGTYLIIPEGNEIEIILEGDVDFAELGAYISPVISELGDYTDTPYAPEKFPFGWVAFWMILLIIATFICYIALQEWYKKRYESYLFKNSDDLYNVINFIHNSRASGLSDTEIRKKLGTNLWKNEQITYAFNKLDGKRTGMYEIPLFKSMEQKKVREEIAKRQGNIQGGRFIKRP